MTTLLAQAPRKTEEEMAVQWQPLVAGIARKMRSLVGPRAEYEDLVAYGNIGLLKAIRKRDSEEGFGAWAATFIRREMVNGLRKEWGNRFQRSPHREVELPADPVFLVDDRSPDRIVESVESLVERLLTPKPSRAAVGLNPAELLVLRGAAAGLENGPLAESLGKPMETVKSQMRSLMRKLGATNRTHAVAIGYQTGILR